jgi:hypothetical protein
VYEINSEVFFLADILFLAGRFGIWLNTFFLPFDANKLCIIFHVPFYLPTVNAQYLLSIFYCLKKLSILTLKLFNIIIIIIAEILQ